MRLLTHNTLRNNSAAAKGKGFPLRITVAEVRVEENAAPIEERQISFVQGVLPTLDWPALVQVCFSCIIIYFGVNFYTKS